MKSWHIKEYIKGDCRQCDSLVENRDISVEEAVKSHNDCHGWNHCGEDCCGICDICGDDGYDESNYVPMTPMAQAIFGKIEAEWRNKR